MAYSAISVKGGKVIVKAMKRLAMAKSLKTGKNHNVGELVFKALQETYGDEFQDAVSFFADSGHSNDQLEIFSGNG